MAIRKPKNWDKIKPPVGYMVDWSDPINKDLRGCWLFNEGAGNAAFDATGRFGKAALAAGQTWTQGHLSCSGSNTNATVSASSSIDVVGKFSGSVWVYPKVSNVYQVLFSRSSGGVGTDRQYSFLLSGAGTAKLWIALGGTDIGDVTVSPTWTANKWNHLVLTADGANARLYINGVLANTTATVKVPTSQPTYPLVFGAEGTGFPLNGLLGSERIFARVLSQAEIRRLYAEPYAGILTPRRRLWPGPTASGGTYTLTAASASFALTGTATTLRFGRALIAASASYALTGNAAALRLGRTITAASASYALTGNAATLAWGHVLLAGSGAFALTGNAATLTKTNAGAYVINAGVGSFILTGNPATLRYSPIAVAPSTQGMGPGWNLFGQPHQPSKTYVHDTIEADIHRALEAAEEAQSPRAKRQAVKELREVAQSVITEAKAASDDAGGQHLARIAQSLERAMRLEMSATALLRNVREALELERLQQEDDAEALMLIAELI